MNLDEANEIIEAQGKTSPMVGHKGELLEAARWLRGEVGKWEAYHTDMDCQAVVGLRAERDRLQAENTELREDIERLRLEVRETERERDEALREVLKP